MSKTPTQKRIKKDAKRLRKLLKNAMLYGVKLDSNNPDHVLLAAYYFGVQTGDEFMGNIRNMQDVARIL